MASGSPKAEKKWAAKRSVLAHAFHVCTSQGGPGSRVFARSVPRLRESPMRLAFNPVANFPKATRRRLCTPKVRRRTDSSRGELREIARGVPMHFARSAGVAKVFGV